ncbi:unnamed protein product [Vicia faba]|uniref:Uncharacterized protein n=1 Tax=Vicia faba TaxID=3906 RepID=A0AAV0YZT4_VICFA|nr:unnamed protein product [Vicia faba]
MIVTTIIFGAVFWQKGKEINTHRDLFNVFGSINVFFYGLFICTASLLSTAVYTIFILFSGFLILGPISGSRMKIAGRFIVIYFVDWYRWLIVVKMLQRLTRSLMALAVLRQRVKVNVWI